MKKDKKTKKSKNKKQKKTRIIIITILLITFFFLISQLPTILMGKTGHMTLLTISEFENKSSVGGTADLYLKIKQGSGNVYIDTFPLSKLDTQISTRFAKEIACTYAKTDCSRYDFFYTIRAQTNIVGGPSAGAALSALTVAILLDKKIDEKIAMTGTINAGGIIGPVGGVNKKILAAEKSGMHSVIIPAWQSIQTNEENNYLPEISNKTDNRTKIKNSKINEAGNKTNNTKKKNENKTVQKINSTTNEKNNYSEFSIKVVEISSLDQAMEILTGEGKKTQPISINTPENYNQLMYKVSKSLCNRSEQILSQIPKSTTKNNTLLNASMKFIQSSNDAFEKGLYYTSASYCFSANLRLRELQIENFSQKKRKRVVEEINKSLQKKIYELENTKIDTITDMQVYSIVQERLFESELAMSNNLTAQNTAYIVERYNSAITWNNFFKLPGEKLNLDKTHLKLACQEKILEVEERKNYAKLLFNNIEFDETELQAALSHEEKEEYELCLFKASKAKAKFDVFLSALSISEEVFPEYVSEKLFLTKKVLEEELNSNRFPFMGYSYYEYAGELLEEDPITAAIFSSYALELSDLSRFFPKKTSIQKKATQIFSQKTLFGFLLGIIFTLLMTITFFKE